MRRARVKRWTLDELRELAEAFGAGDPHFTPGYLGAFLDWLGKE